MDGIARDAVDFQGMSGKIFLLAGEPNAVVEKVTSGSRAVGSRLLDYKKQFPCSPPDSSFPLPLVQRFSISGARCDAGGRAHGLGEQAYLYNFYR